MIKIIENQNNDGAMEVEANGKADKTDRKSSLFSNKNETKVSPNEKDDASAEDSVYLPPLYQILAFLLTAVTRRIWGRKDNPQGDVVFRQRN